MGRKNNWAEIDVRGQIFKALSSASTTVKNAIESADSLLRGIAGKPDLAASVNLGGGGGPYNDRIVVLTTDNTAGTTADGGNLTDVTTAAQSSDSSTFSFQGVGANHSILFGADISSIKHWGLRLAQTVAAVEGTKRSFAFELWTGSQWVEFNVMAFNTDEHYRYGNEVFLRSGLTEDILFGIDDNTTWQTKLINGKTLFWTRIRITNSLSINPVFEEARLIDSGVEVNSGGHISFQGLNRYKQSIFLGGNSFGEVNGVGTTVVSVGTGASPASWPHQIKNSYLNSNLDAFTHHFKLPVGICTAHPVIFRVTYQPRNGGVSNANFTMGALPIEVSGVYKADPSGGVSPVIRTLSNTEDTTSKAAQTVVRSVPTEMSNKLHTVDSDPIDISNYYEGDMLALFGELTDDGANNANLLVWGIEVVAVMWALGGRS
jgi:hypothetical protein